MIGLWLFPAMAAPTLHPPLHCQLGVDCWISSRPDAQPGQGFRDHAGGSHTYEGHKGTDWAVKGVEEGAATPVLAPAAGRVTRVRDGVDDGQLLAGGAVDEDEACGNGVVIELEDDWELQLCHLRRGTVLVKPGDPVQIGTPLGRVGLSGSTDHPHVHLTVRHGNQVVDPFSGRRLADGTPEAPRSLWLIDPPPRAHQDALAWAGFREGPTTARPDWPVDTPENEVPATAPSLVLEIFLGRPMKGDVVLTEVRRPDGTVTRAQVVQERDRPRQVYRIEKTWTEGERPVGRWNATVTWKRGGRTRTLQASAVLR